MNYFQQGIKDTLIKLGMDHDDAIVSALAAISPTLLATPVAGLTAPKGEGWSTAGKTWAGGLGGNLLGHVASDKILKLLGSPTNTPGALAIRLLSGMLTGATGGYLAHRWAKENWKKD